VIVAITRVSPPETPPPGDGSVQAIDAGWERLGYDVADDFTLSGLCNCGYEAEEAAGLRPAWSPELNHHGLFGDPRAALRFCSLTDARVPEHAPFFVYGLYRVGEPG
jgi:hypothetical protein